MQLAQSIGLELPLKILVFEDASGKAWVCYNDPTWLARRFGLDSTLAPIAGMSAALAALTDAAGGGGVSPPCNLNPPTLA